MTAATKIAGSTGYPGTLYGRGRSGRVRRSNLNDPFWIERFLFARHIPVDAGSADVRRTRRDTDDNLRSSLSPGLTVLLDSAFLKGRAGYSAAILRWS